MEAWAHCPNCSNDYPKRFDLQIEVEPEQTHSTIHRRCPACKNEVRLSIAAPVIHQPASDVFELPDELESYVDDDTTVDCRTRHSWFVYVLECQWRQVGNRDYDDWKYAAHKAYKRVYVGSTDDLARRLVEHQNPTLVSLYLGSEFTRYFAPKRFMEIHSMPSKEQARGLEERRARELNQRPGWFVWQN